MPPLVSQRGRARQRRGAGHGQTGTRRPRGRRASRSQEDGVAETATIARQSDGDGARVAVGRERPPLRTPVWGTGENFDGDSPIGEGERLAGAAGGGVQPGAGAGAGGEGGLQAGAQLAEGGRGHMRAGELEEAEALQQGRLGAGDGEAALTQLLPQL